MRLLRRAVAASNSSGCISLRSIADADLRKHQDVLLSAKVETQVAVLNDPDISSLLFAM